MCGGNTVHSLVFYVYLLLVLLHHVAPYVKTYSQPLRYSLRYRCVYRPSNGTYIGYQHTDYVWYLVLSVAMGAAGI